MKKKKDKKNAPTTGSVPGQFVIAPRSNVVSINNKNPASRSGTWHVTPQPNAQPLEDDSSRLNRKKRRGDVSPHTNHPPSHNHSISVSSHRSKHTDAAEMNHSTQNNTNTSDTWLYVAGVANKISANTVKQYVMRRIGRENVYASLLLPRGVDPTSRQHLSFKVRIPTSCTYLALDKSFWPENVSVRLFDNSPNFQPTRQWQRLHNNK